MMQPRLSAEDGKGMLWVTTLIEDDNNSSLAENAFSHLGLTLYRERTS